MQKDGWTGTGIASEAVGGVLGCGFTLCHGGLP
jgi:hypothetical protein